MKIQKNMATLKDRITKWKENRTVLQKAGDILFWVLIILFLIPGPRKAILTTLNRVVLQVKAPRVMNEEKQEILTDLDYNWILAWGENEPYYFSNLRFKVIFVKFWATWCPPCVAEMPEIQSLYRKYGDRVAFVLATNDSPEEVEAYMEKHQYQMPTLYLTETPPGPLSFSGFPTTFIISKDGRVVSKTTGAANWDSKATAKILDELLK
ncbi:MAG: TlpA disulfide reductase family protein [Bacteroidota bacterium]|nr:TlpA disulfide reductase family protein [Bacteroidota bacterium]